MLTLLALYVINVRQQTHTDMWCWSLWVSQVIYTAESWEKARRPRQAYREHNGTYNTTLGLGLNVQFQNSIAWGGKTSGNFKKEKGWKITLNPRSALRDSKTAAAKLNNRTTKCSQTSVLLQHGFIIVCWENFWTYHSPCWKGLWQISPSQHKQEGRPLCLNKTDMYIKGFVKVLQDNAHINTHFTASTLLLHRWRVTSIFMYIKNKLIYHWSTPLNLNQDTFFTIAEANTSEGTNKCKELHSHIKPCSIF